ncbi:hypothetical protein GIB67_003275 [Kingdonia uniflora]|uniref:Uncharacterized protein n=1 Tax=Kingdonia uniflora TaxID=39325 RepID=A0A7J7LXQ4_9MAGN|nr:hypothetical protein GIB67_003275 [Kingdonia uniflora]
MYIEKKRRKCILKRGYNGHLNKTNIRVSTHLRRVIERERVKQAILNAVQESLEVEANERRKGKNDLEHTHEHVIINGFDTTYTTWIHHGEQFSRSYVNSQSSTLPTNNVEDPCPPLVSMVNDTLEHLPNEVNAEDEVNVEAHVEATTYTCNNEGVNQA